LVDLKDPKDVASFLYCSSSLEERTFSLYRNLAEKTSDSLARSIFTYIAYDSLKHSVIMKGIAQTISASVPKSSDCEKKLASIWTNVADLAEEVINKQRFSNSELPDLSNRLAGFENSLSEEYFILVQSKTLQFMAKELSQLYNVDFENVRDVFGLITKDEENHREILYSLVEHFTKEPAKDTTPVVKYQHPEAW